MRKFTFISRCRRSRRWSPLMRHGASLVEFAMMSPVMFAVFFGSIEFARLNQINNTTASAAYAGCRRAIVPGASVENATAAVQTILSAGLVSDASITVDPAPITSNSSTITVTVAVPMNQNGWSPPLFTRNLTVTRSCTLTREKTNQ